MKKEIEFFAKKCTDENKLEIYGFKKENGVFFYQTKILDGQFLMLVYIKEGEVQTKLIDTDNECEYTLHNMSGIQGEFVAKVRTEYEDVLSDIRNKCFINDIFKSDDAKAIMQYVSQKYDTPLEFLWKKFSDNAIYRRKDNQKWFAALLIIDRNKIGLDGDGKIEILDLRMDPTQKDSIIDNKKYFPGYHMNKKSWYTICLNGSIKNNEIFERIDMSYELAKKK